MRILLSVYQAAYRNNLTLLKKLVAAGADVNQTDEGGNPPINMAILFNNYEAVKFLVENGADLNKRDIAGKTSLEYIATLREIAPNSRKKIQNFLQAQDSLK